MPRDHDAEQLRLLKEFRSNLQREALCFPFKDGEDLRRRVTRDLASTLNRLAEGATAVAAAKEQPLRNRNDLARIGIRASGRSRQLGIEVTSLTGELENLSSARRIKQCSVTLTVPRLCLSFANVNYAAEIPSNDGQCKKFRYTERNHARVAIHPGDTLQVVGGIEISVEHLAAADRTECLDPFITADAAVDDEALQVKKKVRELIQ